MGISSRRGIAGCAASCALGALCSAGSAQQALCTDGYASLQSKFDTGVTVVVGPAKTTGLAERSCSAFLQWDKNKLVVAEQAAQVDVDLLGADVGLNVPVVAFEVRQGDSDPLARYEIYSLQKPPRLLRRLSGAQSYSTADVDLDGRVAIWADDAGAFDGMDGLLVGMLATPPMAVLRFEQGQLVDAGAEFQPQFDAQIAALRREIDADSARTFKQTDGRLATSTLGADELNRVLAVKARVLELAWLFLSSGRVPDAWDTLREYWPAADLDRIRGEIGLRRAKGIRSQVDGIASGKSNPGASKNAPVFDQLGDRWRGESSLAFQRAGVDSLPRGIRLSRPEPEHAPEMVPGEKEWLDLVVDSAGKVRAASMISPDHDDELLEASKSWKFIPAFRSEHPVACRFKMFVYPYR